MIRALAIALVLGCGSSSATTGSEIEVPEREVTAGDRLLAIAPAGADAILEVDFGRLRGNSVVGPLVAALTRAGGAAAGEIDLFGAADTLFIASYGIGDDDPERLILLVGVGGAELAGATALDDGVVAIASEVMRERLVEVRRGAPALSTDHQLLRLRALAMPAGAPGASVRLAAHLDFDAQVAVARALELDDVPASVSVWGDVADDLAVIAMVGGSKKGSGTELARALGRVRDRLAATGAVRRLLVARHVRGARVEARGTAARLVLVIGPERLSRLVDRLKARLGAAR